MIYECRVLVEAFSITWVLPVSDDTELSLGGSLPIGAMRDDGQFTAVLNGSESVGMVGAFKINSTILIKPPLGDFNNSVLTCTATAGVDPANMSTITLSGELRHNHVPYSVTYTINTKLRILLL